MYRWFLLLALLPSAAWAHGFGALYNLSGAVVWVGLCLGAGYLFGNVPVVKENFSLVALGIVLVSVLPMAVEYWRVRRTKTNRQGLPLS